MKKLAFPLALVVAAALSAQPALAQKGGHGHGHGNGKHQSGEVHGNRDRDRDRDDDHDRSDDRRYRNSTSSRSDRRLERRVPPGWCIGRGNPHNTVENCGRGNYRYDRRYDPRYNGGVTYDRYGNRTGTSDRYGSRTGTYDRYGNRTGTYNGTNRDSYNAWKRDHDLRCRDLARQRPLDLRYQLQVRNQCSAEDQEARRRYGV
ncbi:MAG TPA: hypothetical protein VFJ16_05920 [Longimicrobium sp.]|nr:hypothetical protein [Longimicrobium sp.]